MEREVIQSIEAESSLISCLLCDDKKFLDVVGMINEDDFYSTVNKNVFTVISELFKASGKYDMVTITDKIKSKKYPIALSDIARLFGLEITSANTLRYAEIVKDKSLRRQLIKAQQENDVLIYNEDENINTVLTKSQDNILKVSPLKTKSDKIVEIMKDLEKVQEEYSEKYKSGQKIIGFSSGIDKLDNVIDGLRAGHFWVVGGWHGTGKTSFVLNIVHSLIEQEIPLSIISLEMSQVDLAAKLIGIRHKTSSMKILKGMHKQDEQDNIEEGKYFLNRSDLEIHVEFEIDKIKMQIRKDVYTRGVKVVVIDYLQKMIDKNIYEETPLASKASKELANLAQELKITIILLSQISNEAQKGNGAGAGFKGSGTIEASADLALVLKRNKQKEEVGEDTVPVTILITKNKFGFDGAINYYMHLPSGKFMETYVYKAKEDINF